MYEHMIACGMTRAASIFLEESDFFPIFKANNYSNVSNDILMQAWSQFYFKMQNVPLVLFVVFFIHSFQQSSLPNQNSIEDLSKKVDL